MNITEELNEKLRESCCMGDIEGVYKCLAQGADINSKNKMNGWTSLHWATKRGHTNLADVLLKSNANPLARNSKNETPFDLANSDSMRELLGKHIDIESGVNGAFKPIDKLRSEPVNPEADSKFVPNYLKHPIFPYVNQTSTRNHSFGGALTSPEVLNASKVRLEEEEEELVLKVREANCVEIDFIEIELSMTELTFENLKSVCLTELDLQKKITKVRKLPNTILRKDKDVRRLKQFQEIEIFTK